MQRNLLSWALAFGLLICGFGASVLALNADLYSAHGFVRAYLDALARQDAAEALDFDGVTVPEGARTELLADAALGELDGIRYLGDVDTGAGHLVRFATLVGEVEQISEFQVERVGTRFGLFPVWRFTVTPLATLSVSVDHDTRFTANGVGASSDDFAVLVPAVLTLDHETRYLTAAELVIGVGEVGSVVEARLEVEPNEKLEPAAGKAIGAYLDECVAQEVLKPTGCPMGTSIAHRLEGLPTWSMESYPAIALRPEGDPGLWTTVPSEATAHLVAEVRSLFDGTLSTVDQDVPFTASYRVAIGLDDSLSVWADVTD